MPSFNFVLLTIIGSGLLTWLGRVSPFLILKRFNLSPRVIEFLGFVPIVIMSALWFENLFIQHLGHLPSINWPNLIASVPTLISAVVLKNLLIIVIVGVVSLAILRLGFGM